MRVPLEGPPTRMTPFVLGMGGIGGGVVVVEGTGGRGGVQGDMIYTILGSGGAYSRP